MEHRVRAAEARVHFGALIRRVVERGNGFSWSGEDTRASCSFPTTTTSACKP
jgi:hypothetical protein